MSDMQLPLQVQAFLALTGQRIPIIQAPIGSAATPELAAAVTRAGGLGGLALTWSDAAQVRTAVRAALLRHATDAGGGRFGALGLPLCWHLRGRDQVR